MLTLPEMIFPDLVRGNIKGRCVFCNKDTDFGWKLTDTISNNFSGWPKTLQGKCACEYCHQFFSDQNMRRKSWVATTGAIRFLDRKERLKNLFNPPQPPFFIYLASIGQKQGWLGMFYQIAYSQDEFYFGHESYGAVYFSRKIAEEYKQDILQALGLKITKTELRGDFHMKTWERAFQGGYEKLLRRIENFKHNNLWEVFIEIA